MQNKQCISLRLTKYESCLYVCMFVQAGAEMDEKTADILSSVPMKPLSAKQQMKLSMPVEQVRTGKIRFVLYIYIFFQRKMRS